MCIKKETTPDPSLRNLEPDPCPASYLEEEFTWAFHNRNLNPPILHSHVYRASQGICIYQNVMHHAWSHTGASSNAGGLRLLHCAHAFPGEPPYNLLHARTSVFQSLSLPLPESAANAAATPADTF
jgi:hypothetical protein